MVGLSISLLSPQFLIMPSKKVSPLLSRFLISIQECFQLVAHTLITSESGCWINWHPSYIMDGYSRLSGSIKTNEWQLPTEGMSIRHGYSLDLKEISQAPSLLFLLIIDIFPEVSFKIFKRQWVVTNYIANAHSYRVGISYFRPVWSHWQSEACSAGPIHAKCGKCFPPSFFSFLDRLS